MPVDAALVRFFAGPPLPFVTAWRHATTRECEPHAHEAIEMVWHRRGRGTTSGAAGTIAFAEGSVVIHPPLTPHDQTMAAEGEDICVQVRAARPLPAALRRPLLVPRLREAWVARELEALAASPPPADALAAGALALRATAVFAALSAAAPADTDEDDEDDDGVMAAARSYLAMRFRDPVAVDDVARHVGLSGDHLRHRFTRAHGLGIVAWLRALRVARAKELLTHAPMPLAEVARQCGFGTDRYLSDIFRRATGMTPGEYRARHRPARA